MTETGILIVFFCFVVTSVTLAGYAFSRQSETPEADVSALAEPELPGTRAFFAQAFRKVGENVPAAKTNSNPMRNLLMSAGYRYPSAVPIFYGIRSATAMVFSAIIVGFSAFSTTPFLSGLTAVACAGGFGFLLPEMVLKRMVAGRRKRIRRGIPAALDLLVLSIESGQSLNQSMVDTSVELRLAHPDLSAELWQVHLELRAGQSRAEAPCCSPRQSPRSDPAA